MSLSVFDNPNLFPALLLCIFAGLSTGIGGLIAFTARENSKKFLPVSLGFSAGVMIYVSMIELFQSAQKHLLSAMGQNGKLMTVLGFFAGMLIIGIIDRILPEDTNPHEVRHLGDDDEEHKQQKGITKVKHKDVKRVGLIMMLAITAHNFPEGMATLATALDNPSTGLAIAIAIAIHNIPEGIAVAVPVYYATHSKMKALRMAIISGLAEPVGAIAGLLLLGRFLNEGMLGFILAAVGGIMVFISFDELLPTAQEYGGHHLSMFGLVAGMAVMAATLVVLV